MKAVKILTALGVLACGTASATTFDLAADYSTTNGNPNSTWTYGWFHNALPGGSSLVALPVLGDAWNDGAGHSIWKNNTAAPIGQVAPGQVALNGATNEPAVVRWIAPSEIGLAAIQIEGVMPPSVSGIEIRRGAGIFHAFTNTSAFNVEMMVEPGDEVDFVAIGGGTIPLDLSITTLKEHLDLTNFDDFDRYYPQWDWTAVPGWGGFRQLGDGTNSYVVGDDQYGWGKGAYRDLSFSITTNTSHISIRSFAKLGSKVYGSSYGSAGIRLCSDNITTGDTRIVEYFLRAHATESDSAKIYFVNGDGASVNTTDAPAIDTWVEFRADMDLSYESDDGKFGLFSLFQRLSSSSSWRPVDGMVQQEMKIVDPAVITKICATTHFNANGYGFLPHIDDIRICSGENGNLGPDTNLLTGSHFNGTSKDWRNDGYAAKSRISSGNETVAGPFHDGTYLYQNDAYTSQVYQVVNLLNEGFSAEDIDAGMYRAAFGGWQLGVGASSGQIEIEYLDMNEKPIGTNSLSVISNTYPDWVEQMATNQIPAQTRSIRFSAYLSNYARLDDAHLSILGIPMDDVALTVSSIHGSPVPAVGTTSNAWGTEVTCSVEHVNAGTTQYECIGWTGTGSVPTSGTETSVDITLTEDSSIVWNWATNYLLDVNITGDGSVDADDGFYLADSEQILTATPDPGWLFMGWSGDASGTNNATVGMDAPKAVLAVFSDDADGDGLLNSNETAIGSNPWKSDTDGDGFGDKLEVDHNWNPTVSDQWAVDHIAANGEAFGLYPSNVVLDVAIGQMVIETSGGTATLSLQLEESDDLVTWTNAGPPEVWIQPVSGDKKYFRVRSSK